jgi:hypothetical protein
MKQPTPEEVPATVKVALSQDETRAALGGISRTSFWKLEKAGLIRSLQIPGLRRRLYPVEEIRRFVETASTHKAS